MMDSNIAGDSPTVSDALQDRLFDHPPIRDKHVEAVAGAVRDKDLSMPNGVTGDLEDDLRTFFGSDHVLCTQNGTSALYSALYALGEGDAPETALEGVEVICPTYNAWFAIAPVLAFGGTPVFCDIREDSMTLDLDALRDRITDDTGIVMMSYMHSETSDLDELRTIADEHDLTVVEDASRVWGCRWDDDFLGTIFDVGALSMGASKTLVSGEGGVFVTDDREYYERAVALGHYERLMGIEGIPGVDDDHPFAKYQYTGMGYKFRISPLSAALAHSKLQTLDEQIDREKELMAVFREAMADIPAIELVDTHAEPFERGGHFVVPLKLDVDALSADQETVIDTLKAMGLRVNDPSGHFLHLEPRYEPAHHWGQGHHPTSDTLVDRVLIQPAFRGGSVDDVRAYAAGFEAVLSRFA